MLIERDGLGESVESTHTTGATQADAPLKVLQAHRDYARRAADIGDVSHAVYFSHEALLLAIARLSEEVAQLRAALERR